MMNNPISITKSGFAEVKIAVNVLFWERYNKNKTELAENILEQIVKAIRGEP